MSTSYSEIVDLVRDWANRDAEALPETIITSGLRYAADEAYRLLKIPPLEFTTYYYVSADGTAPSFVGGPTSNINVGSAAQVNTDNINDATLLIPSDLVSFTFVRKLGAASLDSSGNVVVNADGTPAISAGAHSVVFNQKADIRTYHDMYADKTASNFWSRQGNKLLISGDISEGDIVELQYYRRLPALNSREPLPSGLTLAQATASPSEYEVLSSTQWQALDSTARRTFDNVEGSYVRSVTELPHWLRDENEKVILFGALFRVFDYLHEPDQAGKYQQRFFVEIEELNREEANRSASGGNCQINYNGFGML